MKTFKFMAAQGDLLIRRIDDKDLPADLKARPAENGKYVVAHSETGHHHYFNEADVQVMDPTKDDFGMTCYLKVEGDFANLIHDRSYDTHETIKVPKGTYEIRRQREYTPEGWRRVED